MFITSHYLPEYRDQVYALAKKFEAEFLEGFGLGVNEQLFDQMVEQQQGSSYLLFIDGKLEGLLSGVLIYAGCIKGGVTWQEVIWYVNPEHRHSRCGIALFKYAVKDLTERGVGNMIMAHLNNELGDKMDRIYRKLGFRQFETHYIRRLSDG